MMNHNGASSGTNPDANSGGIQISFGTSEPIEVCENAGLLNLPSSRSEAKARAFDKRVETFFTDLIATELARESDRASSASHFGGLKIWLYDTHKPMALQRSGSPDFDSRDLEIISPVALSRLERIYVLDNGLSGEEYVVWKETCEALFEPLFHRFVAPQEPPEVLKDFMVMRFGEALSSKLYLYLEMKKNMFFNALVIQTQESV